jgi:outer membrane protein, adhesin transport system
LSSSCKTDLLSRALVYVVSGYVLIYGATAQAQSLEQLVAEAVRNHPRIAVARATAYGVQAEIDVAQAALRPKLNFSGGGGRGYDFSRGTPTPAGDVSAQGVYPLWDADRSINEVSRQEARFLGAQQKANQTRDQLVLTAVDAFLEVVKLEALTKIASDNVAAHQALMEKVQEIVQLDRGRAVDATQVAVRLQQARVNLNAQRNGLNEARAIFADLLGRSDFQADQPRDLTTALPRTLAEANAALEEHPNVKAARADAKASELSAKIASAWDKPKVEVLGTLSNPSSATNRRYFSSADVRLNIQWSAFDGGAGLAAAKAAQQQRLAAEEQTRAVLKELTTDVSRSWAQLQSRAGRVTEFVDLSLRAREVRLAYWEQFRIGRRSILDLLNAENESFSALLSAEQVRYETIQLQYRVLATTGRLSNWLKLDEPVVDAGPVIAK